MAPLYAVSRRLISSSAVITCAVPAHPRSAARIVEEPCLLRFIAATESLGHARSEFDRFEDGVFIGCDFGSSGEDEDAGYGGRQE